MGNATKICAICRADCSDRARIKDPKGRYFCKTCYEEAVRKKRAREAAAREAEIEPLLEMPAADAGAGMMAEILERSEADARAIDAEPSEPEDAGILASMPLAPSLDPRLHQHPNQLAAMAHDTVRAEYVKPIILLVVGIGVTLAGTSGIGATLASAGGDGVPAGSVVGAFAGVFLLVHLAVGSVIGAAIFWLASKLWLGDLGPVHLTLLRVAGINAAVLALIVLMASFLVAGGTPLISCFGVLFAALCWIRLTMWLFDLDVLQVLLLIIFIIGVQIGLGFVLRAIGVGA